MTRHFQVLLGAPPAAPRRALLDKVVEATDTDDDNEALLRPIAAEELLESLKLSPRSCSCSPRVNGLAAEFYLATRDVPKNDLPATVHAMLRCHPVAPAPSHTRGVMTLIPKSGKVLGVVPVQTVSTMHSLQALRGALAWAWAFNAVQRVQMRPDTPYP